MFNEREGDGILKGEGNWGIEGKENNSLYSYRVTHKWVLSLKFVFEQAQNDTF